jgi:hypothetical protein
MKALSLISNFLNKFCINSNKALAQSDQLTVARSDIATLQQMVSVQSDQLSISRSSIVTLQRMVFDLQVEVEAIRETLLESNLAADGSRSIYGIAYLKTASITHDSAGCIPTDWKLLSKFYSNFPDKSDWRECLFMERIGFSAEEIAAYKEEAKRLEMLT